MRGPSPFHLGSAEAGRRSDAARDLGATAAGADGRSAHFDPPGNSLGDSPRRNATGSGHTEFRDRSGIFGAPRHGGLASASAPEQYNAAFGLLKKPSSPLLRGALKSSPHETSQRCAGRQRAILAGRDMYAPRAVRGGGQRLCRGLQELSERGQGGRRSVETRHVACARQPEAERLRRVRQLDHDFPHSGSSIKEHSVAEKKRLGC